MVEFGERIRRAREAKGMTQQSLAEKLFVARQTVMNYTSMVTLANNSKGLLIIEPLIYWGSMQK